MSAVMLIMWASAAGLTIEKVEFSSYEFCSDIADIMARDKPLKEFAKGTKLKLLCLPTNVDIETGVVTL